MLKINAIKKVRKCPGAIIKTSIKSLAVKSPKTWYRFVFNVLVQSCCKWVALTSKLTQTAKDIVCILKGRAAAGY